MKKVLFYLIEENNVSDAAKASSLLPHEYYACQKISEAWQQQHSVLVACDSQAQAEKIDEYLWQLDLANFIPHNLAGEGPKQGSPIEICWPERRGNTPRQYLINLQSHYADFATIFNDVIDFVPPTDELKNLARERYKCYKNAGFNLKTMPVSSN